MTARTEVLERANAESSQTTPSRPSRNPDSNIQGSWNGSLFIITGLEPHHFPLQSSDDAKSTQATKPSTARAGLKRKRTLENADSQDDSATQSNASQSNSQAGSVSGVDSKTPENGGQNDNAASQTQAPAATPRKRRRRGQRILEQSIALSKPASPPPPLVSEEEDRITDIDLPNPFLSRTPSPDPHHPDDEASAVYRATYEPLTTLDPFIAALTRINPAQRRTENLFQIAVNTAKALRAWQDEYLVIDRLTAPHAPIPRKPATGSRQPLGTIVFEDQKEADIYDYIFDPKRIGHQDPLQQRVIRDASGRELRQRGANRRTGADGQLVNSANAGSDDENARAARHRRPVSKYDGVGSEDPANETYERSGPTRRGRGGRGRGRGRGGRGGRGGGVALSRRIHEMRDTREGSTASAVDEDDDDVSVSASETYSRASLDPSGAGADDDGDYLASGAGKRKGRPPGSKNLHVRSDKGIPKGPRAPKPSDGASPAPGEQPPKAAGNKGSKQPKSEKRSESMTAWWARRKAAAAEAKRREAEAAEKKQPSSAVGGTGIIGNHQRPQQSPVAPLPQQPPLGATYNPSPLPHLLGGPMPRPSMGYGGSAMAYPPQPHRQSIPAPPQPPVQSSYVPPGARAYYPTQAPLPPPTHTHLHTSSAPPPPSHHQQHHAPQHQTHQSTHQSQQPTHQPYQPPQRQPMHQQASDKMLPSIGYLYDRPPVSAQQTPQQQQQQQQPQQPPQVQQAPQSGYARQPLPWEYVPFAARKPEQRDETGGR